ncbi:Equilibrative nucleotide transporter 8 [Bienertia sinuspersici]
MEPMKVAEVQTKDTCKIAYILHFFLGAGNLLPWNTFITAIDYFTYLYPSKHVERVFSVAYMTSSLFILLLMINNQGHSIMTKTSFRIRMNVGMSMFIMSLIVAPTIDWAKWSFHERFSFIAIVTSVVVCGLADGLIAGSLIGSAGKLPKEYMQAASLPENPQGLQTSAHFYFIVSAIILIVCTICSNLLFRLPVMQQHQNNKQLSHLEYDNNHTTHKPKLSNTAKNIISPAFGIMSIYVVTLSIFPGFISDNNQKSELLKTGTRFCSSLVYNFSDLVGKSLTALCIPSNISKVTWACLARVMFYPGFRASLHGPKWLRGEVFYGDTNFYAWNK